MFTAWDMVRQPHWHPMSMLELSLMDPDVFPPVQMLAPLHTGAASLPTLSTDNDDFFMDLPIRQPAEEQQQHKATKSDTPEAPRRAFSSYSFSQSSVVDDQGRNIASTRRRYEDSSGRLKAMHEREVDGRRLVTTWNRQHHDEQGEHRSVASQGTADDFERLWADTPFGKVQELKHKELKHEQASSNLKTDSTLQASPTTTEQSGSHAKKATKEPAIQTGAMNPMS